MTKVADTMKITKVTIENRVIMVGGLSAAP